LREKVVLPFFVISGVFISVGISMLAVRTSSTVMMYISLAFIAVWASVYLYWHASEQGLTKYNFIYTVIAAIGLSSWALATIGEFYWIVTLGFVAIAGYALISLENSQRRKGKWTDQK